VRKVRLDGKKVKELRESRDRRATQLEFAHQVSASERQLRLIENANKPIGIDLAGRIAEALNRPLEELLLQADESDRAGAPPRPQASPENHAATETGDDLIALGPDIVAAGELVTVGSAEWVVRIKKFVIGDIGALVTLIDRFRASPPNDRYVLVNALGDGRSLADAPTLTTSGDAHSVHCPVAPSFPRKDVRHLNMTATSPETNDLFIENGSIARVSGAAALPQSVRQCLSMHRGESPFNPDYGARLAEYFHRFRETPYLAALFKLEVIRQAAIPYANGMTGGSETPLHCVERVLSVEPLSDTAEKGRLPVHVAFDVNGAGRWEQDVSLSMPGAATLEKIRERGKVHAAIHGGRVVTRGMVEAVTTAPDTLSRVISRLR
jgi:transcriptional regulator with XRE-family HTH domain